MNRPVASFADGNEVVRFGLEFAVIPPVEDMVHTKLVFRFAYDAFSAVPFQGFLTKFFPDFRS